MIQTIPLSISVSTTIIRPLESQELALFGRSRAGLVKMTTWSTLQVLSPDVSQCMATNQLSLAANNPIQMDI